MFYLVPSHKKVLEQRRRFDDWIKNPKQTITSGYGGIIPAVPSHMKLSSMFTLLNDPVRSFQYRWAESRTSLQQMLFHSASYSNATCGALGVGQWWSRVKKHPHWMNWDILVSFLEEIMNTQGCYFAYTVRIDYSIIIISKKMFSCFTTRDYLK